MERRHIQIINISFYFLLFPILRVYVWSIMRIIGGGRIRMRMRRIILIMMVKWSVKWKKEIVHLTNFSGSRKFGKRNCFWGSVQDTTQTQDLDDRNKKKGCGEIRHFLSTLGCNVGCSFPRHSSSNLMEDTHFCDYNLLCSYSIWNPNCNLRYICWVCFSIRIKIIFWVWDVEDDERVHMDRRYARILESHPFVVLHFSIRFTSD